MWIASSDLSIGGPSPAASFRTAASTSINTMSSRSSRAFAVAPTASCARLAARLTSTSAMQLAIRSGHWTRLSRKETVSTSSIASFTSAD